MNTSKISKLENTKNRILWRAGEKSPIRKEEGDLESHADVFNRQPRISLQI